MRRVLVPPMLADLVSGAIIAMDGACFDTLESCPCCGAQVSGYDHKVKRFATVMDRGAIRTISVTIKRFRCLRCGRIVSAKAPFYPGTRLGAPLIDLCTCLARIMACSRVSRVLEAMGVIVDRGSVRNYVRRHKGAIPSTELFGLPVPHSFLYLVTSVFEGREGSAVIGAEAFFPGSLPSADRAAQYCRVPSEKGDQRDKQEKYEKRQAESKE